MSQLSSQTEELNLEGQSQKCLMELKETIELLESENLELKRYSDILAHDLRAPLRNLSNLALLIEADKNSKFSKATFDNIEKIKFEARSAAKLIEELRQLSRQDLAPAPHVIVNTNSIIERVLELHKSDLETNGASVERDEMPNIIGNSELIWQLFDNLIRNAIKHGSEPLKISIALDAKSEGDTFVFSNSIRKNDRNIGDVFGFSKHGSGAQDSTGIGLFVCKKIVALHGGEISANRDGDCFFVRFKLKEA